MANLTASEELPKETLEAIQEYLTKERWGNLQTAMAKAYHKVNDANVNIHPSLSFGKKFLSVIICTPFLLIIM